MVAIGVGSILLIFASAALPLNNFRLLTKCFIVFLPFEEVSLNWAVNFIFQIAVMLSASVFFAFYFSSFMILMNHSCWIIESTIIGIRKMNLQFKKDSETLSPFIERNFKENLKKNVDLTCEIINWNNEINKMYRLSILAELLTISALSCLFVFTFELSESDSKFLFYVTIVTLIELLFYCWMGARVEKHIKDLSAAVYEIDWHLMTTNQQQDIKLVLQMTQKIKSFDGVLEPLNMDTFQQVNLQYFVTILTTFALSEILEFSFSLFKFLEAVNCKTSINCETRFIG